MERPVMIVGGERDGEIVAYAGPVMREPVPTRVQMFTAEKIPPISAEFAYREYRLRQWADRRGPTQGRRYVLADVAKGLGAE
jgi:hypothetical protein